MRCWEQVARRRAGVCARIGGDRSRAPGGERLARLALLGVVCVVGASRAAAQAALAGVVRDQDDTPLRGVHVQLRGSVRNGGESPARVTSTADAGTFRFDSVPNGWAQVIARRVGFRPETLTVEVPQRDGARIVVPLQRVMPVLRPVVVRASVVRGSFAAFERRRAAGFGHFVTRTDIERRRPQRVTDLLRTVPGMTLEPSDAGTPMPRFRNASVGFTGGRCDPIYWVDGTPLGPSLDLDALNPAAIEGIELYSGIATVPAALRGIGNSGTCGVIAVWTRHGERRARATGSGDPAELVERAVAEGHAFTAAQVEQPAVLLPSADPAPSYPAALRDAHVGGEVVAEFVIDEHGELVEETIGIVSATHAELADAVRTALPRTHFTAAVLGGRSVRQVVHLPVTFDPEYGAHVSRSTVQRAPSWREPVPGAAPLGAPATAPTPLVHVPQARRAPADSVTPGRPRSR